MTDAPKIVRERLRAGVATDTHPDANVLTAFSEQLLPESERASVLHHLARCGECREIVSLALPEKASTPALQPARSVGWLAWPNLRWAFVAAGILVIASLGTIQYRRYTQASNMAAKRSAPALYVKQAENKPVATPVPPPPPAVQESKEASDKAEPPSVSKQGKQEVAKPSGKPVQTPARLAPAVAGNAFAGPTIGGPLPHGPRLLNQFQQNPQNANVQQQNASGFLPQSAAAPAPVPFAKVAASQQAQAATSSPAARGDASKGAGQNETTLTVQSESVTQQPSTYEMAQNNVERAKPADELHLSANRKVPAGTPAQFDTLSGKAVTAPRWTINSSGALQRSYDQGNTWQDVKVATAAPPAAESLYASRPATKDSGVALAKKSPPPVFRAVAANGSDVWAGGSSGMLYHSIDSGIHWNRIVPAFSGFVLTGDVIALDFPDSQHGKVTTSSSEVWTTSDAGQTWRKQ